MTFQFENLGYLKHAALELGDLTILCGKNNTGKTYAAYVIYDFLQSWERLIDFQLEDRIFRDLYEKGVIEIDLAALERQLPHIIEKLSEQYAGRLPKVFNVGKDEFHKSRIHLLLDNDTLRDRTEMTQERNYKTGLIRAIHRADRKSLWLSLADTSLLPEDAFDFLRGEVTQILVDVFFSRYFSRSFIITSERLSIPMFYKELDASKENIVRGLVNMNLEETVDPIEFKIGAISKYSTPVRDNIALSREISLHSRKKSFLMTEYPALIHALESLLPGQYNVVNDEVAFQVVHEENAIILPLHFASTAVRSLLYLTWYIKHVAQKNDLLIIDEPELNLHPENQRRIARILTRLMKAGIRVLITTHSDYLIKELNNLIILGNDFAGKEELMAKYHYTHDDILDKSRVSVYIAENNTFIPARITDLGIEVESFDQEILEMNAFFNEATAELDLAYDE